MKTAPKEWADDNPFFLLLTADREHAFIDLGKRNWLKTNRAWLRREARWHLVQKAGQRILAVMDVLPGEQPYYVARHVGVVAMGGNDGTKNETVAYGIGKKRLDGHVDRLWFMANGAVTLGDDLEKIAVDLLRAGQI